MSDIRALTGIRGVAALWVVLYHIVYAGIEQVTIPVAPLANLVRHGYLAVDLFFVLSGYVMALAYGKYVTDGWTISSYLSYLRRRLARVYPLYLVTTLIVALSIYVGASHALSHSQLFAALPYNLLMIQAWGLSVNINQPAWSISTEFAAYLLFPLLAFLPLKAGPGLSFALGALCLLGLYLLQYLSFPPETVRHGLYDFAPNGGSIVALLRCLMEFTLGLVVFHLSLLSAVRAALHRRGVAGVVGGLCLVALMTTNGDFAFVALVPLLILCLLHEGNAVSRFMASPAVWFLGEISYSIYLLHAQFLRITWIVPPRLSPYVVQDTAFLLSCLLMVAVLIGVSYLSYQLFEKPCRKWIAG